MEFFHVLNRGVEKRNIVIDDHDRARFIHDLFVFNDQHAAMHAMQPSRLEQNYKRTLLVRIHAFCLMGNHYHLLLSEVVEGGISLFMQKLNMGYTKYFNERHQRAGTLWQGKYKKISIERNAHFLYIPFYIHLNPLDFKMPEWRKGEVTSTHRALKELHIYRWSSHLDYLGEPNFPSLIHFSPLLEILGTRHEYERGIGEIIKSPELADASFLLE